MSPPAYEEGELNDKPPHFEAVHSGKWTKDHPLHGEFPMAGQSSHGYDYRTVDPDEAQLGKSYYYAMVEMIDEAIGSIMEALQQASLEQNTIIFFTSDHGELLGDHGIWLKGPFHYEPLINVPLLCYGPGYFSALKQDAVVSLVDIVPTILELCGLPMPAELDGVSLKGLLQGRSSEARQVALVEYVDDPEGLRLKTVVSTRYKYTVYYGEYGKQTGELYDLLLDPAEKTNVWGKEEYMSVQQNMQWQLLQELEKLESRAERKVYA